MTLPDRSLPSLPILSLFVALAICTIVGCAERTIRREPTSIPPSRFGYGGTNSDASFVETDNATNTTTPTDVTLDATPGVTPNATGTDATANTNTPTNPFLSSTPPSSIPQPATTTHDLPYGTPVAGKPGFVTSPHSPNAGYVDVRGFPPGTEVKDPYSGKTFLVP